MQLGIGDDAAVLEGGAVWSIDVLVEGVHFDGRLSDDDVGWKAVAVSVSDIVAMGARPRWVLLGLSLPDADHERVDRLARGVHAACEAFDVALVGGDTTRAPVAMLSSTVGGTLQGPAWRRSGASPGDDVWVTGPLGAAGAGWSSTDPTDDQLHALRRPFPPLQTAARLRELGVVTAAMDLSDGLATDLTRLCTASGVGARIRADQLPVAPRADLRTATRGGEDYQLLFTAAPHARDRLAVLPEVSRIGRITDTQAVELDVGWPAPLFDHFGAVP